MTTTVAYRIGQRVQRADNESQVGAVIAVLSSRTIRVKWDNGWREDCAPDEIEPEQ